MFPFPPLVLLLFSLVSYWTRLIFAPLSTYSSFSYFFFFFLLSRRGTESWCLITPQMAAGFSVSQRHFCAVQCWWEGRETFQSWTRNQIHPRCLSHGYPGTAGCVFSCLVSFLLRHFLGGSSLWGPLGLSAALAAPALSRGMMDCDLQRPLSTSATLWCSEVGEKQEWRTKEWV